MSIKSDKWIRRMAESHAMISPFEPNQVRHTSNGKIVSHGTSSYGYDIRCSNEFKIFTKIKFITTRDIKMGSQLAQSRSRIIKKFDLVLQYLFYRSADTEANSSPVVFRQQWVGE